MGLTLHLTQLVGTNLRRSYQAVRKGGRVISYGFAGQKFGGLGRMIFGVLH